MADKALAIDVGGTNIKAGLVRSSGEISKLRRFNTPKNDPSGAKTLDLLSDIASEYSNPEFSEVLGICVPGLVDPERGVSLYSGTLGWRDLGLVAALEDRLGSKVFLNHDLTAAGFAELRIGAAKGFDSAVVIAIGTALAAAMIIEGKVYHPHPAVGELGHAPSRIARECVCGRTGCLEMTVSGGALSRNYLALSGNSLTAAEIIELAGWGEINASNLWGEFVAELGFAIHHLCSTLAPEAVVIAGGFANLGAMILDPITQYLDEHISVQRAPQVMLSKFRGEGACIGAGMMALERANAQN